MDFTAEEYVSRDAARLREVVEGPPVTWVLVGDSITQGLGTGGERGYAEHVMQLVRAGGRTGDVVVTTGAAGATTETVLQEFHWRVGRFAPDVVLVMLGTNDALEGADAVRGFRYRLDQVVQRVRDLGATAVLQTPPPVIGEDGAADLAAYADAVREVGRSLGVVVVDHHAAWSAAGAPREWYADDVHPSARGHRELARGVADTLHLGGVAAADPVLRSA